MPGYSWSHPTSFNMVTANGNVSSMTSDNKTHRWYGNVAHNKGGQRSRGEREGVVCLLPKYRLDNPEAASHRRIRDGEAPAEPLRGKLVIHNGSAEASPSLLLPIGVTHLGLYTLISPL
jgi:hypothetical protein